MGAGRAVRTFPSAYRLSSSEDFRRVYRTARRGRVGPLAWHARVNACDHPRLGLAVPKRILRRATDRARMKRLIRESFRHNRSQLAAMDIVVTLKAPPGNLRDPALRRMIDEIWRKVPSGGNDPA